MAQRGSERGWQRWAGQGGHGPAPSRTCPDQVPQPPPPGPALQAAAKNHPCHRGDTATRAGDTAMAVAPLSPPGAAGLRRCQRGPGPRAGGCPRSRTGFVSRPLCLLPSKCASYYGDISFSAQEEPETPCAG